VFIVEKSSRKTGSIKSFVKKERKTWNHRGHREKLCVLPACGRQVWFIFDNTEKHTRRVDWRK